MFLDGLGLSQRFLVTLICSRGCYEIRAVALGGAIHLFGKRLFCQGVDGRERRMHRLLAGGAPARHNPLSSTTVGNPENAPGERSPYCLMPTVARESGPDSRRIPERFPRLHKRLVIAKRDEDSEQLGYPSKLVYPAPLRKLAKHSADDHPLDALIQVRNNREQTGLRPELEGKNLIRGAQQLLRRL